MNKQFGKAIEILTKECEFGTVYINNINPDANKFEIIYNQYPYQLRLYRWKNIITGNIWYEVWLSGDSDFEYALPDKSWIPEQYFQQSTLHDIPYEQYELAAIVGFLEAMIFHTEEVGTTSGKPVFSDFLLQSIKEYV